MYVCECVWGVSVYVCVCVCVCAEGRELSLHSNPSFDPSCPHSATPPTPTHIAIPTLNSLMEG